jgi:hypothetical protein
VFCPDVKVTAALFIHCGGDQSGEQTWGPEHKGMTAASKRKPHRSRYCVGVVGSRPGAVAGKADVLWEEMGMSTIEADRGKGPSTQGRVSRDNAGKDHLPAGTNDNLQRPFEIAQCEVERRILVWRMSPYELRWRGNAFLCDGNVTPDGVTP